MTTYISQDQHHGYEFTVPMEDYILSAGILLEDENDGEALSMTPLDAASSFEIRGKVYGYASTGSIRTEAGQSSIVVARSGIVNGYNTIVADVAGPIDITNHGYIDAINTAIVFNATSGTISNDGLIYSRGLGTFSNDGLYSPGFAISVDGESLTIENNGKITGANGIYGSATELSIHLGAESEIRVHHDAIFMDYDAVSGNSVTVINEGVISADRAFFGGAATTHFTNKGEIFGDVELSNGDDIYIEKGKLYGTLYGRDGSDTYVINSSRTRIEESTSGSLDTVKSSVSYSLERYSTGIENLTLTGKKDIDATGSDYWHNILIGNKGDNRLDGGTGDDTLTGGKGDDVFVFGAASNIDTITDFQQDHDIIEIHAPAISAFKDLNIYGNAGVVYITYSAEGDPLDRIVIQNADAADFGKGDFIFV